MSIKKHRAVKTAQKHQKQSAKGTKEAGFIKRASALHPVGKLLVIYTVLVLFSATAAMVYAGMQRAKKLPDPFPPAQHLTAKITLYYPAALPKGYQIDLASAASIEPTVVVFRITNPSTGAEVAISQQRAPKDFNFNILYNSFEGKTSYTIKLGTVTTGTIDNGSTRIASLVTKDETWILLNTKNNVSEKDLRGILSKLTAEK